MRAEPGSEIFKSLTRMSCLIGAFLVICAGMSPAAGSPNVVLIVSDDQGYGDIGSYDHPDEVRTPNLDRLARHGVRLTNGYASASVCAPTRAGLMTGRYQQRFGFYTASDSRKGMPTTEITIADLLLRHGYATGVFGKWHLGVTPPYHPLRRGFEHFYGFLGHGAHDYFDLKRSSFHNSIYRDGESIDDTGYLTDNLGREAIAFIERNRNKRFFLYLPFNAVHWPLQAPKQDINRFNTGSKNRNVYLAMLYRMDLAVGKVLDALEGNGLDEKTLIFFLSDNGGARKNYANNGRLRNYKQSVYEGGIRVPFLLRWTGTLPENSVIHQPVSSLDIFPTICAAVGIQLPSDRVYDGKNLLPILTGNPDQPLHQALYWDGDQGRRAVRAGRWKLVMNQEKVELFDLENDLGERHDLSTQRPDLVNRLKGKFDTWRRAMAPRIGPTRSDRSAARQRVRNKHNLGS